MVDVNPHPPSFPLCGVYFCLFHHVFGAASVCLCLWTCFVLRLFLPETGFFRNIHEKTHTWGKGFARGFIERTELLLFFDLVYNDKPERRSAQIKIGPLQIHGVNSLSWKRQMRRHIH
jgi:hypothetical protein